MPQMTMNSFEDFAGLALEWLWQTSLAAAVLVGLVLLLQAGLGRWLAPRWTCALWMLVVLRLIVPFAPESRFSIWNIYSAAESPSAAPLHFLSTTPPEIATPSAVQPARQYSGRSQPVARLSLAAGLVGVWIAGSMCYLLVCFTQYRWLLSWVRRQASLSDPRVLAAVRSAQQLLGFHRDLIMVRAPRMSVPAVLGIVRPCVLLPPRMLENWSDAELKFAMLHELIHIRRRDHLLNWGLIFVQAVHWFNPFVWLALRRFRAEREVLCDHIVLRHLAAEHHLSYGATLIKAAEGFASRKLSASLVPILNHQHEIHRRIRMIARFKPASRLMSALALAGVLALACITFTGAAQKEKPARETPPPVASPETVQRHKSLETLEKELAKIEAQIHDHERRVEQYRHELRIPSHIANGDGNQPGPHAETLRKLEGLRIEAEADLQRVTVLQKQLSGMSRNDLRKVIQTAAPDQQLALLLDRSAESEQKFASLSQLYSDDHPEVKSLRRVMEKITQQIDERLDGVLAGLKARRESLEVQAKHLRSNIEEYVQRDLDGPTKYRDCFNAKRALENLYLVRDRLHLRLIEEKIDAALPPKSGQ